MYYQVKRILTIPYSLAIHRIPSDINFFNPLSLEANSFFSPSFFFFGDLKKSASEISRPAYYGVCILFSPLDCKAGSGILLTMTLFDHLGRCEVIGVSAAVSPRSANQPSTFIHTSPNPTSVSSTELHLTYSVIVFMPCA